jgi:hypothetical protein
MRDGDGPDGTTLKLPKEHERDATITLFLSAAI